MNRERETETGNEVPSYLNELGRRIREVESAFDNREAAAKAAGVAKSTLQSWINGRDPSFEALVRLCAASRFNIQWLATGEGPKFRGEEPEVPAGLAERQQPYGEPLDEALMRDIIAYFEEIVAQERWELSPREHADAILQYYKDELAERARGAHVSPARVLRLVRGR